MGEQLRRLIIVILGWLTIPGQRLPDMVAEPTLGSGEPVDLTLRCEGNIGDSGSDSGTAGGATGNPSDSGGGGGGGGGIFTLPTVLTEFANNPRGFILGAVLTTILEAVTGVVTTIYSQLVLLVGGSQPAQFNAPGETLGLADVPVVVADTFIGAGGVSGDAIITGIEAFNATIADAAAAVGPFGPLVLIVLISVEVIVAVLILQRLVYVIADLLQLGGLTE